MAADTKITAFNLAEGATAERKMLSLWYEDTSGESSSYEIIGYRVEDSSMETSWSNDEDKTDIIGSAYGTLGAPVITQNLSDWSIIGGNKLQVALHNDMRYNNFANLAGGYKFIIVYHYAGTADTAMQAERYPACKVKVNSLGGSTETNLDVDITFGGQKEIGTAAIAAGVLTFTKTEYPTE